MRKLASVRNLSVLGLAAAAALLLSGNERAEARPQYFKEFSARYTGLKTQVDKVKCNVCHYGKSKKMRNDWGVAVSKNIGKNQKKAAVIKGAFTKAEKMEKSKGVTFGSLIKSGKLPGTPPKD